MNFEPYIFNQTLFSLCGISNVKIHVNCHFQLKFKFKSKKTVFCIGHSYIDVVTKEKDELKNE